MATRNGLEPSTSSVTGWRANRLHHRAKSKQLLDYSRQLVICKVFFQKMKNRPKIGRFSGAGDEARTRYLHLGKVALYRMSYTREEHDLL